MILFYIVFVDKKHIFYRVIVIHDKRCQAEKEIASSDQAWSSLAGFKGICYAV